MLEITSHQINECNQAISITAMDEPGPGGANHQYRISVQSSGKPSWVIDLPFQNGPIREVGINGITQEVLMAVVKHRLECFQSGAYACVENATALDHVNKAIEALHSRTKARAARGVEGTHAV